MEGPPRLRKSLGQHHLVHGELCAPLLAYLRPSRKLVVEIGPGGGVLTAELLAAGARVMAVELDPAWAVELRRRLASARLAVIVGDALELDFGRLPPGSLVTGNLPYNIATPVLERLLRCGDGVARAAFLVQLEVAHRLVAVPGSRDYGPLTLLAASQAWPRLLGRVKPGSFRPPPRVEGAFVGLERRAPVLPRPELEDFLRWVRELFGQRRKTLRNVLARLWGRATAEAALASLALAEQVRAETLDLPTLVALYRARPRELEAKS